jgi:hypothetical protein
MAAEGGRQLDLLRGPRQRGRRLPSPSEFSVHCLVAQTLERWLVPGWTWWHPPNGELRETPTAIRLKRMGVRPGVSDFHLIGPPHASLHALELKRRGSKPTLAQAAFLQKVRTAGGYAAWVDSYEGAIDILTVWGALPRSFEVQPDGSIVVRRP